ncbi:hypothetical protein GCM10009609_38570 [Pseudonocardia aurantiaca]
MTVPRRELMDLLDRATAKNVTIISAPPGSGKTTLLRMWGDRPTTRGRVAAVSVRRGERDPQHFWLSVLEAERAIRNRSGPWRASRRHRSSTAVGSWKRCSRS